MQVKLNRQVIIEPDETGGYVVSCPSLPGCHSQGETLDEAFDNIREAIELYLEVLREDMPHLFLETLGTTPNS